MDIPAAEGAGGTFGGGDGSAGNPYVIEDVWDLQNMSANLSAHYVLGNDIDASATASWNSGAGFLPIGTNISIFTGSMDGRSHTISGLHIDRPTAYFVGLFGYIGVGATVKDVGLVDISITGANDTGGLVGWNEGTVSGSYSSGYVTGTGYTVGGLVGYNTDAVVNSSHSTANVKGVSTYYRYGSVGGLIGSSFRGIVTNSYASGNVTGATDRVGGLIGNCNGYDVSQCYATGDVLGATNWTGGLIGRVEHTEISRSYATGNVTGDRAVGGLLGSNFAGGLSDNYATGEVSGRICVGGLVGVEQSGETSDCYFTGNVTGNDSVGGLLGYYYRWGVISNSHYNVDDVLINGGHHLTTGGLFDAQYDDWFGSNLSLNISDYNTTLAPAVGLDDVYDVSNVQGLVDLLGFADVQDHRFRLTADIDLSTTPGLYIPYLGAEFDGNYHNISNLQLNMSFASCLGMFGITVDNPVKNIGIVDCDIVGADRVGGLVGSMSWHLISNSFATGRVVGGEYVGGLVGFGSATMSFASVNVTGETQVGGLAGYITGGYPTDAYASGSVTGDKEVGGFTGSNANMMTNCYSSARVSGNEEVGGLTGSWGASIIDSFWDIEASGQNESVGGTGKTTAEMKRRSTFTDAKWDFSSVWCMIDHVTYPLLRWQDTGPPVADAGPDQTVGMGILVTFDGSGSIDETGLVYTWTFVDGSPVTLHGVRPEYRFDDPGTFNVTLGVTDAVGHLESDQMTVTVKDTPPPIADAGPNQTVEVGSEVTLSGIDSTANVGITSYQWSFGYDGSDIVLDGVEVQFLFTVVGEYEITLKVTDQNGLSDIDEVMVWVLDRTSPMLEVFSPVDDELTRNATYTVTGMTEPFTRVDINVESSVGSKEYSLTSMEDGSFEMSIGLFEGIQNVVVTATDAMGNPSVAALHVTLDTIPPDFIINSPDEDYVLTRASRFTIVGTMIGDLDATLWIHKLNVAHTGVFQFEVELEEGENLIVIKAVDEAGNEKVVVLTIVRDSIPPVVTVTAPPEDYLITNDLMVHFEGAVRNAVGVVIQHKALDLAALLMTGTWEDGEWEYDLELGPTDLEQDVAVIAYDLAGNEAMMVIYVRLDIVPPQLSMDGEDLSYTNQTIWTISGTTEEGIETVTVNGINEVVEGGVISVTVDLEEGMNTFEISVVDEAGNPTSVSLEITRDTVPPTFEIDYPKQTDKKKTTISGTCSDDVVRMLVNGHSIKVENGTYEVEVEIEEDGKNLFIITFEDQAGNTVTETITISKGEETPGFGAILAVLAMAASILAALSLRKRR